MIETIWRIIVAFLVVSLIAILSAFVLSIIAGSGASALAEMHYGVARVASLFNFTSWGLFTSYISFRLFFPILVFIFSRL